MAAADLAVGLLAASKWRLAHLAVGTFGGCQMAVRAKWLLGRLAVGTIGGCQMAVGTFGGCQMAVRTFGGQGRPLENGPNGCWAVWRSGHLAVGRLAVILV